MLHIHFIMRQVRRSSKQAYLFVLCVALSLTTLTAFSGFARSVGRAMLDDARILHAADIIIHSDDPISIQVAQVLGQLEVQGRVVRTNIHEFYSVVRAADENASVLSRLKVVEPGYPFYGEVILKSGRPFVEMMASGQCIVEQTLLDRTGMKVGDSLKVGYTALTIGDVVTVEPDRALNLISFGPRVFIDAKDLDALGLMATGSRIRHTVLLKVADPKQVDIIAGQLKSASQSDGERIDTYRTAGSAIKWFLDNFLFFLKMVGLFILMISGLGIQSTLSALFNEKQHTIAIMKTVGATGRFISIHFMLMTGLLGAVGTTVGILAGLLVQGGLVLMLAPFLPDHLDISIQWTGVVEAILLGIAVVMLFSFLPLVRLKEMRPVMIFNHLPGIAPRKWPGYLSAAMFLLFSLGLVFRHMGDIRFGLIFVGIVTTLILVATLLAQLVLWTIKRLPIRRLTLRQAIKGLFRRGNATRAIMVTLTVALAAIFSDYLIEKNLFASFVQSFPNDSPNAFFVDIQPHQIDAFKAVIGRSVQLYPIVRARITAVNGQAIDHKREERKRRDNMSRVFNLTYRETLLEDETLIVGKTLFRNDWADTQVSVMDTVVEMQDMKIGDWLSFKIQGVPLNARISSIRTRNQQSFNPFFYFVFPDTVLKQAPQTLFAAMKVDAEEIGPLQNRIVSRFPNISVIDMSQAIGTFARLMQRLSRIVRVFSLFSIAAGILILVSAVLATRAERIVESVYYKIMGAGEQFVFTVFALENLLIGLLSSLLAMAMAQACAYWLCTIKFDMVYRPFLSVSFMMVAVAILLVIVVGMIASRSIMAKKPVTYLREQQDE